LDGGALAWICWRRVRERHMRSENTCTSTPLDRCAPIDNQSHRQPQPAKSIIRSLDHQTRHSNSTGFGNMCFPVIMIDILLCLTYR
jgi:hypothetical protein